MSSSQPAQVEGPRTRVTIVAVAVIVSALMGAVGSRSVAGSSSAASPTAAGGEVPDGVTAFDEEFPAVANLDPDLLGALRTAASAAADDGVELNINSGWRSAAYQARLFREAIFEHGSEEEATRWVATARTSPHVSGDAVDIRSSDATSWLSEWGAGYGLCQIYGNEPWHYELRPDAVDDGCPAMCPDPTHDPGMQQRPGVQIRAHLTTGCRADESGSARIG